MTDDYEKYERECKKIRKENQALLDGFKKWLKGKNLSDKTIKNHLKNVDFYINTYLLYSDAVRARDGYDDIGGFLGDWFVRKAMWVSRVHIKANAASFKKFYTFLHERGDLKKEELQELKEIIKDEMPDWLECLDDHDSGMSRNEIWGW